MQKESYLLELSRYIVLNPVRAAMVRSAKDWPWSSYRAMAGMVAPPVWLNTDWSLSAFARQKSKAIERYRDFVAQGKGQPSVWGALKNQIYLGDKQFVAEMRRKVSEDINLDEVPSSQKRQAAKPLVVSEQESSSRNEAIVKAYRSSGYSMKAIADHFGLHYSSVSKLIKNAENSRFKT